MRKLISFIIIKNLINILDDNQRNIIIEELSEKISNDGISLDEQQESILKKYHDFVKSKFHIDDKIAKEITNEAFIYLKMKSAGDVDPLQEGDKFGAGFS